MVLEWITFAVAVLGLAVALAALSLAVIIVKRIASRDPIAVPKFWRRTLGISALPTSTETVHLVHQRHQRVAFVANPTKAGVTEVREQALRACSIRYLPEPLWLHTTAEDPGVGQAHEAIAAGADLVVAVGGDGTVRAVAEAVAGTGVAMAILPIGTGNLFARNFNLPLEDIPALLRIALEGAEEKVDVGWLEIERGGRRDPRRHPFLVIAGTGIDADMVSGTDDQLKKRLGWVAYFLTLMKYMRKHRMTASVSLNGSPPVTGQMRTVLIANVGRLPGGFMLIPDASATDGQLDIATLDARGGIVGWTDLYTTVVAQGVGWNQPEILKAYRASRIDHARATSVSIRMEQSQLVQVDGEILGNATAVSATVEPGTLRLRVPMQ